MAELSLYERLGGAFVIAAVVDHFSEALVHNPVVGQTSENPALREWHTNNLGRLPGLKFMRTVWVCNVAGGPQQYAATKPGSTPLGLEEAHRELKISPVEFDERCSRMSGSSFGVSPRSSRSTTSSSAKTDRVNEQGPDWPSETEAVDLPGLLRRGSAFERAGALRHSKRVQPMRSVKRAPSN
jgi:hemoglobin